MLPAAVVALVLAWPLFLLVVAIPTVLTLTLVQLVLGVHMAFYFGPLPALLSSCSPPRCAAPGCRSATTPA